MDKKSCWISEQKEEQFQCTECDYEATQKGNLDNTDTQKGNLYNKDTQKGNLDNKDTEKMSCHPSDFLALGIKVSVPRV